MSNLERLKPGLFGAVIGAVALAIVGFSWGGWMTGGAAQEMASDQARLAVVAALAPICVEQSKQDPQVEATMNQLKNASAYQRSELLMKAGWATMPGTTDPNRGVANACVTALSDQF